MRYRVTDTAPSHVAGRAVQPGDVLDLSEAAARFEALAGHIVPADVDPAAEPVEETAKPASKRR